ncbi:MAG: hypothetical protein GY941_28765, partial [Planctomycetes bacterium]|nr:hypothetical protein [Planctomycetota bacterium]
AKALGLPAQAYRAKTQFAADFVPGLGDYLGAEDAKLDYDKGNYGSAALGGVLTAAGALLPMAKPVTKAAAKGIRAFHGSPHSFDKFSMDKIGTGEGAQAYGHGLYFAEAEDTAKFYRDGIVQQLDTLGISELLPKKYQGSNDSARRIVQEINLAVFKGDIKNPEEFLNTFEVQQDLIPAYKKAVQNLKNPGSMYEVNIDANPDDFLDWDKPLSEQGEGVRKSLNVDIQEESRYAEIKKELSKLQWEENGLDSPRWVELQAEARSMREANPLAANPYGDEIYHRKSSKNELQQAGIPGIKYKDAGSRAAEGGTSNYVVFDENLISIVKKYGVAGAVSMGLVSQADGEAIAAQIEGEQPDSLGSILAEALK